MLKNLTLFVAVAATSVAFANAQGSQLTIPVKQTHADDGKQMYVSYCAPCHGVDGRGQGPTAGALKMPPADLTMLSKNNKGTYPATHLVSVLKFGAENVAHGSKMMPVWGPVLQKLDHPNGGPQDYEALRISNLVHYVETLQVK